ncbi:hypothetical protein QEG98_17020 [Myxococcus sp. MxC21-1]|uniref:hypothetical protein n=1 Tax=Myxococcus sp. MxC21-1 TaxID=3041439 RepID=UPI00293159AD|nr:hypothetical protein [Myxococcus sp. MxC21-1]WNZ65179.1 hypothetical protein QEG98_17020 [Myxococcus sp. MxC21-1]
MSYYLNLRKVLTLTAWVAILPSVAFAEHGDEQKKACERVGKTPMTDVLVMKQQCRVMCVGKDEKPSFEPLADGARCEVIGFGRKVGTCKAGMCQMKSD